MKLKTFNVDKRIIRECKIRLIRKFTNILPARGNGKGLKEF